MHLGDYQGIAVYAASKANIQEGGGVMTVLMVLVIVLAFSSVFGFAEGAWRAYKEIQSDRKDLNN